MKMFVMLAVTAGLSFGFPGSFMIAKDVKPVELLAYRRGIEALLELHASPRRRKLRYVGRKVSKYWPIQNRALGICILLSWRYSNLMARRGVSGHAPLQSGSGVSMPLCKNN